MAAAADGVFQWKRRMGVHEAYHQARANRVIHWLCIPLELWGFIKLLGAVELVGPVDMALVVIALVAPIYIVTELLVGTVMVAFLAGLWWSAQIPLTSESWLDALIGLALFVIAFTVQTQIGHNRFEPEARDDTEKNLAEFSRTHNPIPLLLIFYYHLVELALAAGYRPQLRRDIESFTAREMESFQLESG